MPLEIDMIVRSGLGCFSCELSRDQDVYPHGSSDQVALMSIAPQDVSLCHA